MIDKEEFAHRIITEYINKSGIKIPVEIHFVDNINDSWILYTKNIKVINQYSNGNFSKDNGLLMPFDGVCDSFAVNHIYISYKNSKEL